MKEPTPMRTKGTVALAMFPALLLLATGCMVSQSKYKALEAERDGLAKQLEERDKDLAAVQDSFRKRFEDASRELEAYKKQAAAAKTETTDKTIKAADTERKKLEDQIRALGIGEVRDGRLVLQGSLLFTVGKATVSKDGEKALDKIATAFKGKDVLIQIDGHTDSQPVKSAVARRLYEDNMGLAADRALAVYRYLARKGIHERSMFVRSLGGLSPIASNATEAGRGKNRRVEILFIPSSLIPRSAEK
jgi:flagellar motor protein MotB